MDLYFVTLDGKKMCTLIRIDLDEYVCNSVNIMLETCADYKI